MAIDPKVRTGLTHFGTAIGGAVAMVSFASSHSVDIYAIMDQLNVIVKEVTKFVALVTPLATGAFAVYKSTTKQVLLDAVNDPKAPEVAKTIPATPQASAVADALKT